MLIIALVSVLTVPKSGSIPNANPLVAYSCRYYYPAGSPKTSVHQIYVSDVHGGHRRQVTFDLSEKTDVQWVGKHKLAWVESNGISESETEYGYHVPVDRETSIRLPEKLITYDLRTDKRKIVARGSFRSAGLIRDNPLPIRGAATYTQHKTTKKDDIYSDQELKTFVISSIATKVFRKPLGDSDEYPPHPWSVIKFDKEPVESNTMFNYHSRSHSGTGGGDGITRLVTLHGRTVLVPLEVEKVWKSADNMKCWFRIGSYAGSGGSSQWIYEIDWQKGTCVPVADEVYWIDFAPPSRFWSSASNGKATTQLGKIRIWQCELWCGDVKSGKQWRLAAGPVHGNNAAIQP